MSDTVPTSAIVAALAGDGLSFAQASHPAAGAAGPDTGVFHVSGAVSAPTAVGSGPPLLVDFVTCPVAAPTVASPTVAGAAGTVFLDTAQSVSGSIKISFEDL